MFPALLRGQQRSASMQHASKLHTLSLYSTSFNLLIRRPRSNPSLPTYRAPEVGVRRNALCLVHCAVAARHLKVVVEVRVVAHHQLVVAQLQLREAWHTLEAWRQAQGWSGAAKGNSRSHQESGVREGCIQLGMCW